MKQVLIHAGFHKTGTTSVQKTLIHNRKTLRRHYQIFTRRNMPGPCEAARAYSISRTPADLLIFSSEMAELFSRIDAGDPRPALLSSEDLSGHMPGRYGLNTYAAAPLLMKAICHTATQAYDAPIELTFLFTTRNPEPWLRSCYAQHLRAIRLTQDFDSYRASHAASADLANIVARTRLAVAPHKLHATPLESLGDRPLGPLAALLDVLETPRRVRRRIEPLPPANISPPQELLAAYLETNRSTLDDDTVAQAKIQARRIWLTGKTGD